MLSCKKSNCFLYTEKTDLCCHHKRQRPQTNTEAEHEGAQDDERGQRAPLQVEGQGDQQERQGARDGAQQEQRSSPVAVMLLLLYLLLLLLLLVESRSSCEGSRDRVSVGDEHEERGTNGGDESTEPHKGEKNNSSDINEYIQQQHASDLIQS